jgi:hypothetical protein
LLRVHGKPAAGRVGGEAPPFVVQRLAFMEPIRQSIQMSSSLKAALLG